MALTKKLLTPSQFGLSLTPVTADGLLRAINAKLKTLRNSNIISVGVYAVCEDIIKFSNSGTTSFNILFKGRVSPQEIGIILSDFGELAGALYMLKKPKSPYIKVKFPTAANEKLIDYILIDKNNYEYPISAKSGAGGKPSITAVTPLLKNMKLTGKAKLAADIINLIGIEEKTATGKSTGTDLFRGPLLAADKLGKQMPAYAELIKILRNPKLNTGYTSGIPTIEQLDTAMANAGLYPTCVNNYFKPFLMVAKTNGFEIKDEPAVKRAINLSPYGKPGGKPHRDKRWGILHYPITANLVAWLNDPKNEATMVLSKAANKLNVTQIYLDPVPKTNPTGCKFGIKEFSEAKFMFGTPSGTPNPIGNRIGLTMDKTPAKL